MNRYKINEILSIAYLYNAQYMLKAGESKIHPPFYYIKS